MWQQQISAHVQYMHPAVNRCHAQQSVVLQAACKCRYQVPARHLEAAVRAVQANCSSGCALKVIDNGSAVLSKDISIGGIYGELDLVILGRMGTNTRPTTLWNLNLRHIVVSTSSGTTTRICFQGLTLKNGRSDDGGGAIQIIGHKSGLVTFSMQDCVLTKNNAMVPMVAAFFSFSYADRCCVVHSEEALFKWTMGM